MVNFFKKYLVLIIFGSVWIIGLLIHYVVGEKSLLWDIWSTIDVAFAVSLGIMAFLAYLEFIKSEDRIEIYFSVDGILKNTTLSLLRKDCTRGEIMGLLGMIQRTTKERFSFDNKELPLFLKEVQDVQKGNKNSFVIEMTHSEFEQFII